MATLNVFDESMSGAKSEPIVLEFLTEEATVREIIRQRVYQEVGDFNLNRQVVFQGLVRPVDAESTPEGFVLKKPRAIDWKEQFAKAIDAFKQGQILILVNELQAESLEDQVTLTPESEVSFLRLVPLVGG